MLSFTDVTKSINYKSSVSQLNYVISVEFHKMRNFINSIINQTKIINFLVKSLTVPMSAENLSKKEEECIISVNIQKWNSNLLLMNLNDVLSYTQIMGHEFSKVVENFDVRQMIEKVAQIPKYETDSKDITLKTTFDGFPTGEGNYNVESDEMRIKQVLLNFYRNAIVRSSSKGSIKITAKFIKVRQSQMDEGYSSYLENQSPMFPIVQKSNENENKDSNLKNDVKNVLKSH